MKTLPPVSSLSQILIALALVGLAAPIHAAEPMKTDRLYEVGLSPQAPIDQASSETEMAPVVSVFSRPQGFEIVPDETEARWSNIARHQDIPEAAVQASSAQAELVSQDT